MAQSGEREAGPSCASGERVNTDCTVVSVMSISPHGGCFIFLTSPHKRKKIIKKNKPLCIQGPTLKEFVYVF